MIPISYVHRALDICDDEGAELFAERRGFRASTRFPILWKGTEYPSKAILREACTLYDKDHPGVREKRRLSGGYAARNGVSRVLAEIGIPVLDKFTGKLVNKGSGAPKAGGRESPAIDLSDERENPAELLEARGVTRGEEELRRELRDIESGPAEIVDREIQMRRRSVLVKAIVLARAEGICECCDEEAPFETPHGTPYLEVHHMRRLADDGADNPANAGAVCPTCHREIHFGIDGNEMNRRLALRVRHLEEN